jgi:hypothetical protein
MRPNVDAGAGRGAALQEKNYATAAQHLKEAVDANCPDFPKQVEIAVSADACLSATGRRIIKVESGMGAICSNGSSWKCSRDRQLREGAISKVLRCG